MTVKKLVMLSLALELGMTVAATPSVSEVEMSYDVSSGRVTVSYVLAGSPAIVTCDFQTNSVSIGDGNLHCLGGDVNRKVTGDGRHQLTWNAAKSWPGHALSASDVKAVVTAWDMSTPPDYMVADLVAGAVRYYTSAAALPDGGVSNPIYKTERLVMRKIPAKNVEWRMGSNAADNWGVNNEAAHLVKLNEDFYIGVYELTQKQYYYVTGTTPACNYAEADKDVHPVEKVNFNTMRGNAKWNEGGTAGNRGVGTSGFLYNLRLAFGGGFDFPLEAQWEFACRAGSGNNLYDNSFGYVNLDNWQDSSRLKQICAHRTGKTLPVGSYEPNAFGLYDMFGNVSEYCLDQYVEDITTVDPSLGPTTVNDSHVFRGGAYTDNAYILRSPSRASDGASGWLHRGVRLVCPVDWLPEE